MSYCVLLSFLDVLSICQGLRLDTLNFRGSTTFTTQVVTNIRARTLSTNIV